MILRLHPFGAVFKERNIAARRASYRISGVNATTIFQFVIKDRLQLVKPIGLQGIKEMTKFLNADDVTVTVKLQRGWNYYCPVRLLTFADYHNSEIVVSGMKVMLDKLVKSMLNLFTATFSRDLVSNLVFVSPRSIAG